jgi:hypothetical protein
MDEWVWVSGDLDPGLGSSSTMGAVLDVKFLAYSLEDLRRWSVSILVLSKSPLLGQQTLLGRHVISQVRRDDLLAARFEYSVTDSSHLGVFCAVYREGLNNVILLLF